MDCYETIDHMGDAIEGCLAPGAREGFEGHLAECPACRNYLDQLRLTRHALRHLQTPGAPSPHRSELIRRYRLEFRDRS